jgi:lipopolysaccharide transport system ATP-binding protein
VASLLEVGTGFHPELTGRENIFLNGAILGMRREEIKRKFDEIVAFSEVDKFLDTPVKRYSSGMYVRLAFAIAAHLEPEILVVDEVLAVGDAGFQKKCLGKMGQVAREGRTVLFVSHNMAAVQNLCQKALLLLQGQIHSCGETEKIINNYQQQNSESITCTTNLTSHTGRRQGSETILRELRIFTNGNESTTIKMGGNLRIETSFVRNSEIRNMRFGIAIENNVGQRLVSLSPSLQAPQLIKDSMNQGTITCNIPRIRLLPGLYYITIIIGSGSADLDRIDQAVPIIIESSDVFQTGYAPESAHGVFYQESEWKVRKA